MIKVGQIYNVSYLGGKIAITWIRADKLDFDAVRQDGFFYKCRNGEKDWELIAEYPTWQEAVNSKEFKTENEE